jgi:hypothetical protein
MITAPGSKIVIKVYISRIKLFDISTLSSPLLSCLRNRKESETGIDKSDEIIIRRNGQLNFLKIATENISTTAM